MHKRWWDIFRLRFRSLFARRSVECELSKELSFHLEAEIEECQARGLSAEEARSAALKRLGGVVQIEEECRDMRRTAIVENLVRDIKYSVRTLLRTPSFASIMILTLALSIGATTAIVSVVEGVLIRPLPFQDPSRLVRAYTRTDSHPKFPINPNDFRDARARMRSFESFAAYTHNDVQLSEGEPARLSGFAVTAGYFHVLGQKPALGREFTQSDELPGKGNIVIISDRLWRATLHAAPDVLGKTIRLDQTPFTIVGVMPPGIEHPGNAYHAVLYGAPVDAWVPFTFDSPKDRGSHYLDAIARLQPGVSLGQAQGEFLSVMQQIARQQFGNSDGVATLLSPLGNEIIGQTKPLLFALLGAVALVLMLACVNAANLLLARATSRQREMAVRSAVGAGQSRLICQTLTESMVLAIAGGILGGIIAVPGTRLLVSLLPADFPRTSDIRVDLPVFLFMLCTVVATGIIFGLVPALRQSADLRGSLHESGRSTTSTRATLKLRSALVISEICLACGLLIGAGLMLRTFINLLRTDPGFRPDRVLTATLSLPHATYRDSGAIAQFSNRLLADLRSTPGVQQAGISSDLPWTGWDDNAGGFTIRGETPPKDGFQARYHMASDGYFSALGIGVMRGREFTERDTANSPKVLIINQAMARFWRNHNPIGGQVTFDDHPKESDWMTVVGVVQDIKDTPSSSAARPAFWWPQRQQPYRMSEYSIAIHSKLDTKLLADRLRSAVHELDGALPVAEIRTMDRVADGSYATSRFTLALVGLFASLALLLSVMGIYGVIAYSVGQRTLEFGIRMALGARPRGLVAGVMRSGMTLVLYGTFAGVMLGLLLSRFLGSLLYQVSAADPLTFSLAALAAILAASAACIAPALRATRVSPMTALRAD